MFFCLALLNVLTALSAVFMVHEVVRTTGVDLFGYVLDVLEIPPASPQFFRDLLHLQPFEAKDLRPEALFDSSVLTHHEEIVVTTAATPSIAEATKTKERVEEPMDQLVRGLRCVIAGLVRYANTLSSVWLQVLFRCALAVRNVFEALGGIQYDPTIAPPIPQIELQEARQDTLEEEAELENAVADDTKEDDVPASVSAALSSPVAAAESSPVRAVVSSPVAPAVPSPVAPAVSSPAAAAVSSPAVSSPVAPAVPSPVAAAVSSPVAVLSSPVAPTVSSPVAAAASSPVAALVSSPVAPAVSSPAAAAVSSPAVSSPVRAVVSSPAVSSPVAPAVPSPLVLSPVAPAVPSPLVLSPVAPAVSSPVAVLSSPVAPTVSSPVAAAASSPVAVLSSPVAPTVSSPVAAAASSPVAALVSSPVPAAVSPPVVSSAVSALVSSPVPAAVSPPVAAAALSPVPAVVSSPVPAVAASSIWATASPFVPAPYVENPRPAYRPLPAPFHINGFRPETAGFGTPTPTLLNAAGQMFVPRPDRQIQAHSPQPPRGQHTSHFHQYVENPHIAAYPAPPLRPAPFHVNGFRQEAAGFGMPMPPRQPNAAGQMFVPRPDRPSNRQRMQQPPPHQFFPRPGPY